MTRKKDNFVADNFVIKHSMVQRPTCKVTGKGIKSRENQIKWVLVVVGNRSSRYYKHSEVSGGAVIVILTPINL
jgi:hypothetical protein